jgi:hypothetical protein
VCCVVAAGAEGIGVVVMNADGSPTRSELSADERLEELRLKWAMVDALEESLLFADDELMVKIERILESVKR